jgi:hypothetical protein
MYTFCVLRGVLRFFDNTILLTYKKKDLLFFINLGAPSWGSLQCRAPQLLVV